MLRTERDGPVLLLTLDRPEKRNALHPELIRRLFNAAGEARDDASLGVIVITGAGAAFCSGLDLEHLAGLETAGRVTYMERFLELFRQIYQMPQLVIAAVNGPAVAGGYDIAAAGDLRLCSQRASFAQTEVLLGITPMLYPLSQIVGLGRARELALTSAVISADEAYQIGLVNRIWPAEQLVRQALDLAHLLSTRPRQALLETKRLSREASGVNDGAALTRIFEVIIERVRSDEHAHALEAYVARLRRH